MTTSINASTIPSDASAPAPRIADLGGGKGEPQRTVSLVLVEDDEEFREAAAAELEDLGFEVKCFAEGPALLEAFASGMTADVIVLDWNLPTLSGIDLIPRL